MAYISRFTQANLTVILKGELTGRTYTQKMTFPTRECKNMESVKRTEKNNIENWINEVGNKKTNDLLTIVSWN